MGHTKQPCKEQYAYKFIFWRTMLIRKAYYFSSFCDFTISLLTILNCSFINFFFRKLRTISHAMFLAIFVASQPPPCLQISLLCKHAPLHSLLLDIHIYFFKMKEIICFFYNYVFLITILNVHNKFCLQGLCQLNVLNGACICKLASLQV